MKKFKFRLEPFLRFVGKQRDDAQKEVQKVLAKKVKLIKQLQWMESEMKKAYTINSMFGQSIKDIHYVNDNNQFIGLLKKQMTDVANKISTVEQEYQHKLKQLIELQLKMKKIELFKEKQQLNHKKEIAKRLQKQTDDQNSTRKRGRDAKSI